MCRRHTGLFHGGINIYPPVLGRVGGCTVNRTGYAYDENTTLVAKTAGYRPGKDLLKERTPEQFGWPPPTRTRRSLAGAIAVNPVRFSLASYIYTSAWAATALAGWNLMRCSELEGTAHHQYIAFDPDRVPLPLHVESDWFCPVVYNGGHTPAEPLTRPC
jgi:hypothetical protein